MTHTSDIFEKYLQMRESNSNRELADMNMMRDMHERITQLEADKAALEEENARLKEQIAAMQRAQPITKNYNIGRDYIAAQYL